MWVGFEVGKEGCLIPPHTLILRHIRNITTHTLGYRPRKSCHSELKKRERTRREKGGWAIECH